MIWLESDVAQRVNGSITRYTDVLGTDDFEIPAEPDMHLVGCPLCGSREHIEESAYKIPDFYCCDCQAWFTRDEKYDPMRNTGDAMERLA